MHIKETKLNNLLIIRPKIFQDSRGEFCELWRQENFHHLGISFVQDSYSYSKKNVLRGLHYQRQCPQGQLIWVSEGTIFDVCLDIRSNSDTFGQWQSFIISDTDPYQLYMPPGFAHGFCVLTEKVKMHYKCTEYFQVNNDMGIRWNDPDLNIPWPILNPILSERDKNHKTLNELKSLNLL